MADTESDSATASNKVDRVIEKHGLDGLGDELERRWLDQGDEQLSTRELADLFNRRVLGAAIDESDVFTLSGDVDQVYEALRDEGGDDTLVRSRLEQSGIDVDDVESDFVSHQTVYRYLKNHRKVEQPETPDEERIENAIDTIQRLRGRTTAVTERTIESLRDNESITIGEFDVLNDVQILCQQCGRSYDVATLLERGACECER